MKRHLFKVVIIGECGVGKTSLMNRYVNRSFTESYRTTIGADFLTKDIAVDGKLITLQIWDTAGQERFNSLGTAFFRGSDACILVYDINRPETYMSLSNLRDEFILKASPRNPNAFPFIIVGNKCDIRNRGVIPKIRNEVGEPIPYIFTSAKEDIGVDDLFYRISKAIINECKNEEPLLFSEIPIHIDSPPVPDSSRKCC